MGRYAASSVPAAGRGRPPRVADALELVGMTAHAQTQIGTALRRPAPPGVPARAIAADPDLYLLDEP